MSLRLLWASSSMTHNERLAARPSCRNVAPRRSRFSRDRFMKTSVKASENGAGLETLDPPSSAEHEPRRERPRLVGSLPALALKVAVLLVALGGLLYPRNQISTLQLLIL